MSAVKSTGSANELLQRVVIDALESGGYSVSDVRENVETAIERHEQYTEEMER